MWDPYEPPSGEPAVANWTGVVPIRDWWRKEPCSLSMCYVLGLALSDVMVHLFCAVEWFVL